MNLNIISTIVIATALFLAMILQLASKPKYVSKARGYFLGTAIVGGLLFYGYGFSISCDKLYISIIRSLLAVCGMFVGKNEFDEISNTPLLSYAPAVFAFWLIHVFALYTTASAAISTIGAEALKKLRLMLSFRGDLTIIFSNDIATLALGGECNQDKNMSVVYITDKASTEFQTGVISLGAILKTEEYAVNPTISFLKSIGIHKNSSRKIDIYALDSDQNKNLNFAARLLEAFENLAVDNRNTNITIYGADDENLSRLQISDNKYGYGFVSSFNPNDAVARLMIDKCPPWNAIKFDDNCKATSDFDALIIGFGLLGQSALKALVMNGQYEGSTFHATVVSHNHLSENGLMKMECPEIFENYNIDFIDDDCRSAVVYQYIKDHLSTLKYIAVCIGGEKLNNEIFQNLSAYVKKYNLGISVVSCNHNHVTCGSEDGIISRDYNIYSLESISSKKADKMALMLNHNYCSGNGLSAWENWVKCDFFSRKSSRASADFIPAMIAALHTDEQQILEKDSIDATDRQLETLGRTEHNRWCAFHYCMGYSKMSDKEFDTRSREYVDGMSQNPPVKIKLAKNSEALRHACLVSWEQLDELSEKVSKVTGKNIDYKQKDIDNVLMIPQLLSSTLKE